MTDKELLENAFNDVVIGNGLAQIRLLVAENNRLKRRPIMGSVVRELRLAKDWTQRDLAEVMGIPQSHVSRIECGRLQPTPKTILHLTIALGVPKSELECPSTSQVQ